MARKSCGEAHEMTWGDPLQCDRATNGAEITEAEIKTLDPKAASM